MGENMGVAYTGVPSAAELASAPGMPGRVRMEKGPVACIECVQDIPCNPCERACPFGAITVGDPIVNRPALDENKCVGCATCVAACPGQAIFVVDITYSDAEATVEFPYEYLPLPEEGDTVDAVDRFGQPVCRGRVLHVRDIPAFNKTRLIKLAVPKKFSSDVRGMKRLPR